MWWDKWRVKELTKNVHIVVKEMGLSFSAPGIEVSSKSSKKRNRKPREIKKQQFADLSESLDLNESPVTTVEELTRFIINLPGSPITGRLFDKYSYQESIPDRRMLEIMDKREAIYLFHKYNMTTMDRKKMIAAIINAKLLGAE